ncbi:AAA family ATPase [Aquisphaera insulae]|uniref:AAA family ATPase n=1 Tax=Aquisphaera insulae TaxID=2712864 RepID=UPI0013EC1B94|nr:ATP-binding protein [Aquisphaera insulae]
MITRVRFENFRSHGDSDFPLRPITLLIGSVASGKSNIFKGLLFLQSTVNLPLAEIFGPGLNEFRWVRSRWADETDPIGFEVDLNDLPGYPGVSATYRLRIADSPHGLYVLEESLERREPDRLPTWAFQRDSRPRTMGAFGAVDPYEPTLLNRVHRKDPRIHADSLNVAFALVVARALNNFGYYHLVVSALKSNGTGQPWNRIGYYGDRLPDFLAWAKSSEENVPYYERIREDMKELLPELESIIVTQVQTQQQGLAMAFRGQRGYIAAPDLSDGTLLTLGLLSIVHGPGRPNLLCIEEPEAGLNPRRLRWLFDRFIGLAYRSPGIEATQVLFSTHSPWMVDFFRGELQDSVLLVEQTEGHSRVTPLVEIQRDRLHQHPVPDPDEPIGHLWASGVYEGL